MVALARALLESAPMRIVQDAVLPRKEGGKVVRGKRVEMIVASHNRAAAAV